ncbi:pentapeptide repeat-containing protein [Synechococcus elongatus]|uniref:pentapeptide repeat-containing protein n=1 Tax=Synechococcus elongatus TaxID=32046 RepID=UPI000F7F6B65|nr:pentapeptide repeat-containing protein [Synechococcus elongatus]
MPVILSLHTLWRHCCRSLILIAIVGLAWSWIAPAAIALDFTKEILIESDFSNRDLSDANFTKANLRSSDFSNSVLVGVRFYGANLESVDLHGADLSNTILDQARMTNTDLTDAILEGAYAFNALFQGAKITGADFTDVLMRQDAQDLLCSVAEGVNSKTGRATRDTLDCP